MLMSYLYYPVQVLSCVVWAGVPWSFRTRPHTTRAILRPHWYHVMSRSRVYYHAVLDWCSVRLRDEHIARTSSSFQAIVDYPRSDLLYRLQGKPWKKDIDFYYFLWGKNVSSRSRNRAWLLITICIHFNLKKFDFRKNLTLEKVQL
jgi:hypothetical protein